MSAEPFANAEDVYAHNIADVMENGPALRITRRTAVLAHDPERDLVLIGGLGALGVGTMWVARTDDHDITDAPIEKGHTFADLMAWLDAHPQPKPEWCKDRPCRSSDDAYCIDCHRTFPKSVTL